MGETARQAENECRVICGIAIEIQSNYASFFGVTMGRQNSGKRIDNQVVLFGHRQDGLVIW